MTGSVNKAIIVGNLGRDPEVRSTQDGTRIANLHIATSESWKTKTGERKERTEWHRISIMNERLVEVAEKYLRKGSKVYVEGAIQSRKYTDKDGVERFVTEIIIGRFRGELTMLDSAKQAEDPQPERSYASRRNPPAQSQRASLGDELDDSIPF